MIAFLVLLKNF